MSSIDERVVSMRFDNKQFENATKTTMTTLESLKKSLKLDGASKGLEAVDAASKKVDLGKLGQDVDDLKGRFSGLQAIATGALIAIGAKLVDVGIQMAQNLGRGVFKQMTDGLGEYETQINGIQTIMSNTASKGTTMDEVNKALAELNLYADKTIYNFAEMTRNIGTFTAAGVDLETSTAAIKGIANLAASSGSNSQQASTAMYQLSQAMASGTVKLMDWNSVVNAGMGGQLFQDALKETARVHGISVDQMIKENGSFRESLQEGWLTSAVLTDTLAKFTGDLSKEQIMSQGYTEAQADEILKLGNNANDAATKVKTFTQLLDTLAEAQGSGWAQSWQLILGDFEEARTLFTGISDRLGDLIQESADARNAQLAIWSEGDSRGSGRQAVIDGLYNSFDALMGIVKPIKEALREVFPPKWGTTLLDLSFKFRDFTEKLKIGEEGTKRIKDVALAFFNIIKFGSTVVGGILKIFGTFISIVWKLAMGVIGLITPITDFLFSLIPISNVAKDAAEGANWLTNALTMLQKFLSGPLIEGLGKARQAIIDFIASGRIQQGLANTIQWFKELASVIAMVFNVLAKGDFTSNAWFAEDHAFVDFLFKVRDAFIDLGKNMKDFGKNAVKYIKEAWTNISNAMKQGGSDIDWAMVLAGLNTGIMATIGLVIVNFIRNLRSNFDGFGDILEGLGDVLEGYQTKLKAEALKAIAVAILLFAGAVVILSMVDPDRLLGSVTALGSGLAILMGALWVLEKISGLKAIVKMPFIAGSLILLAGAVAALGLAAMIFGNMTWDEIGKGLLGIAVSMGLLVAAAQLMSKFEKSIASSSASMILMAAGITAIAGAVAIFGNMPMDVLIQGGIAVATTLALLVAAAVILEKHAGSMLKSAVGLMAMAAAINMLIVPITTLGLIPWPILAQGLGVVTLMLLGLTMAAVAMDKVNLMKVALGMLAMAIAINLLVAPIIALGMISLDVLIQGLIALAATIAILTVATLALNGAMVGIAGMLALSAAVLVLSFAVRTLGELTIEQIVIALGTLVAVFILMGVAALVLSPLTPILLGLAGAIVLFGLGMMMLASTVAIFALGLMLLGPALMVAAGGLMVFAQLAPQIAEAVPAFLAIGAGLLVFGAGALVAGAGVAVLGLGLILLGAGLLIVALAGVAGATALIAVTNAIVGLIGNVIGMGIMAGAFTALGAGVLVLGAGLLVLGAGALLTGVALALLVGLGALVSLSFNVLTKAFERLIEVTPTITAITKPIQVFAKAVIALGAAGSKAGASIVFLSLQFTALAIATALGAVALQAMAVSSVASNNMIVQGFSNIVRTYNTLLAAMLKSNNQLEKGIDASSKKVGTTTNSMIRNLSLLMTVGILSLAPAVYSSSMTVGNEVARGLARGIQNGSTLVNNAARRIAINALNASKKELGVASPSKEYEEVGMWSTKGLANGLIKTSRVSEVASARVGKKALEALKTSVSKIKDLGFYDLDDDPVIRPVLDLSSFQKDAQKLNRIFSPVGISVETSYATASGLSHIQQENDRQREEAIAASAENGDTYNYTQNITSPKAVSDTEVYRRTKSLISIKKGELPK